VDDIIAQNPLLLWTVVAVMFIGSVVDIIQFSSLVYRQKRQKKHKIYLQAKRDVLLELHQKKKN